MTQDDWIKVIIGLVSGGLAGSILTNVATSWRNRIHTVSYRVENTRVFTSDPAERSLHARVTVLHGSESYEYHNLYITEIELANRPGKDLGDLRFGLSLDAPKQIIRIQAEGQDRHHVINIVDPASPANPKAEVDFTCKPFHRRNYYKLKLYIISDEGDASEPNIRLSSPNAVKFAESPDLASLMTDTLRTAFLSFGPISITIKR